ncbi:MAG: hypothetical protein ABW007_07805 [Chitinophagaceae bacterium]
MKITLTKIGNSKGFRIPKALLVQLGFEHEAELTIQNNTLQLTPVKRKPREGWAEQIKALKEKNGGHDKATLEFDYVPTKFDQEWEW